MVETLGCMWVYATGVVRDEWDLRDGDGCRSGLWLSEEVRGLRSSCRMFADPRLLGRDVARCLLPMRAVSTCLGLGDRNRYERTPSVIRIPRLSAICVTRPPVCAIQLFAISKSRLSRYTLPWMSATTRPTEDATMVEISGVFCMHWSRARRMRG